uniref:Uncharacterized protein n=1 Tax=Myripristis murdjan TaxID=586833 RepID=A0A667WZY4_9TELE
MCVEKQSLATQETTAEEGHKEENDGDDEGDKIGQAEDTENSNGEQDRGDKEGKEETQEGTRIKEIPEKTFIFSSMTSLQREEFFELVATAQARRLDDQRAFIKQLSIVKKPAPLPVPKEDLYNMILTTQAQGRLEDQRSRAPGPMDDEDFFSLLLRVQGGRMEEQRTELPHILQT